MCFFPSSKNYPLDRNGREPQLCYVRKRVGGKVVSRDVMRRDQLRSKLALTSIKGRVPRISTPRRAVSATTEKRAHSHHEVVGKTEPASPRQPTSTKPENTHSNSEKKDGVPSWDTWGDGNEDGNKRSEQVHTKASGDWALHDFYTEKEDTKQNESKDRQEQNTNGKKGGRNGGNKNGKGSGNKSVPSNSKSEKDQGDNTTSDWNTQANEGGTGNSNENAWAPADWKCQEGWESGPSGTNNENNPEGNNNTLGDWDTSPGDNNNISNNNQSEEHDSTQKVPGGWPDRETDSEKDNSAKVASDQTVKKKNNQQGNPNGSKKPRVKGKGGKATVEFCVCEANNSVSFKSAQDILENCQPGEWQQDEHGNPFFQRAQEEDNIDDKQIGFAEIQTDYANADIW